MKIKDMPVQMTALKGTVRIRRLEGGFPRVDAGSRLDLAYGMGYCHGHDRRLQMEFMKLVCQGRTSACLKADPALIELDRFMRWIDLTADTPAELDKLAADRRAILEAYAQGVNQAVVDAGTPLFLRLAGHRPDAWTALDVLNLGRLIGFIGLAQCQGDMEKFILELIREDVPAAKVRELFPAIQEEISAELTDILSQVTLVRPSIPPLLKNALSMAGYGASNNWALRPSKTVSGRAVLCSDPHLAIQLPSIWYPMVLKRPDRYYMGAGMPGLPVLPIGRTPDLAWSVTYSSANVTDYFVEEVKNGKWRRKNEWRDFLVRQETIYPKKKAPMTVRCYETDHGLLEGAPEKDGYYLSLAWTGRRGHIASTMHNFMALMEAPDIAAAMACFAGFTWAPFNWVAADKDGDIGYHMSGQVPVLAKGRSGLVPGFAWDPDHDWQGLQDPLLNPRVVNPPEGYIVTANHDLNRFGPTAPIVLPMSACRADRIAALLDAKDRLDIADMKHLQCDLFSTQAEAFMQIIRPLLPDSENGRRLRSWDCRYTPDSIAATLFEKVYRELVLLVFGEGGIGRETMARVMDDTALFALLFGHFDAVLLRPEAVWFNGRPRETLFQKAVDKGLKDPAIPYGRTRRIFIRHLLLGGRLPAWLGFDHGPVELPGSRSTILQGQLFCMMGQPSTFAPTFRMITDFAAAEIHTNNAGGPSERRFSGYYTMGLDEWLQGTYHVYTAED